MLLEGLEVGREVRRSTGVVVAEGMREAVNLCNVFMGNRVLQVVQTGTGEQKTKWHI